MQRQHHQNVKGNHHCQTRATSAGGIEAAATLGVVGGDAMRALRCSGRGDERDRRRTGTSSLLVLLGLSPRASPTSTCGRWPRHGAIPAWRALPAGTCNVVELTRDGSTVSVDGVTPSRQTGHLRVGSGEQEEPVSRPSPSGESGGCARVDVEDIREMIERQVGLNRVISDEGLSGDWGARIERFCSRGRDDISCRAGAADRIDARMSGCTRTRGHQLRKRQQGIVLAHAFLWRSTPSTCGPAHDGCCAPLALSDLTAIHAKRFIGELSGVLRCRYRSDRRGVPRCATCAEARRAVPGVS